MEISAKARFVRQAPSKVRDLARKLTGLPVAKALGLLDFSPKKGAKILGKALKSAIANAENNAKLAVNDLKIKQAVVDEGPRMKRYWARSRGSASPIQRRMCHVNMILTDGKATPKE